MKKIVLLVAILAFLFTGCTLEKRRYNKGFHVDWFQKQSSISKTQKDKSPKSESANNQVVKIDSLQINNPFEIGQFRLSADNVTTPDFWLNTTSAPTHKTSNLLVVKKSITHKSNVSHKAIGKINTVIKTSKTKKIFSQLSLFKKWNGDKLIALYAGLMGLLAFSFVYKAKKFATSVTKWAKKNANKTQFIIAGIQLPMLGWAIWSGYNLNEMGIELSDTFFYGSTVALIASYFTVPFLKRKTATVLPSKLRLHRLGYIAISVASLLPMAHFGNHLNERHQGTFMQETVSQIDQTFFKSSTVNNSQLTSENQIAPEEVQKRKIAGLTSTGGAVFLLILLSLLICIGLCSAVGGIALLVEGLSYGGFEIAGGILLAGAGVGLVALGVRGIQKLCGQV